MVYTRDYIRLWSQVLGRDMEMLRFGDQGYPMICFPSSNGRFFDLEDRGIIHSLRHHIERGYLQAFCVETLDWETFFAGGLTLGERRDRWLTLELHWTSELIPYVRQQATHDFVVVAGFSLGATHAANLTLRHPDLVRRCLALAGPYDLTLPPFFQGWDPLDLERELYFINPVAYMSNMTQAKWAEMGGFNTDLKFLSATHDSCLEDNLRLAKILGRNGIPHHLEVWEGGHDWGIWQAQIAAFS